MVSTEELGGELRSLITGDVDVSEEALTLASHDASLFEVRPQVVVSPKSVSDIKELVDYVSAHPGMNVTARAAGTDMSGGPLTESVVVSFIKYFNHMKHF